MKISFLQSFFQTFLSGNLTKAAFFLVPIFFGQWFFSDLIHLPGGGLTLVALCAGGLWIARPLVGGFDSPTTTQGWLRRCQKVLEQFQSLEDEDPTIQKNIERAAALKEIVNRDGPQRIAFVGSKGLHLPNRSQVESSLTCSQPINLAWSSPLPLVDDSWIWPQILFEQDLIVYVLPLPLRAAR